MVDNGKLLGHFAIARALTKFFFNYQNPLLEQTVYGIKFANPVGLSAGFDKDAELINILPSVGFGFQSVGSITAKPYEGNPKPWLYRLKKTQSIVVNFGLKNVGVDEIIKRIRNSIKQYPLMISVAKTNSPTTTDTVNGITDYVETLSKLEQNQIGDIYEINISCPNAFGGESFTTPELLEPLLARISSLKLSKPIFIKMPINLPFEDFKKLLDIILKYQMSGVIIGNLNKDRARPEIKDKIPEGLKGNLSGKPTFELSNNLISETYNYCGDKLKIIGVGGIFSAADAYEKIKRGASLVQLITGMIFEGPALIGNINEELVELLKKDRFTNISQAIGTN